jgi:hypothetical protein
LGSSSDNTVSPSAKSPLTEASTEGKSAEDQGSNIDKPTAKDLYPELAIIMLADPTDRDTVMPSVELKAMEDVLESVKKDMEADHAAYVYTQLLAALKRSNELQESLPDFRDKVDPFANMPPIDEKINETMEIDHQVGSTNYDSDNDKLILPQISTDKEEASDTGIDPVETANRVPKYKHYITITRSMLVPDDPKLHFEPVLDSDIEYSDQEKRDWLQRLKEYYDPPEDLQASRHREHVDQLKEYLPSMLKKAELKRETVISYMIDVVRYLQIH